MGLVPSLLPGKTLSLSGPQFPHLQNRVLRSPGALCGVTLGGLVHLRGGTGPQPLGSPWAWDGGSSRGSLPWLLPLLTSCLQQLLSLISSPQSHYDHHGNQAVFVPTGWKNLTQDCRGGGASATRSWLRTCQILREGHYLPRPHSYPLQKEAKGQLAVWGPAPSPARLIHLCKAAGHFSSSPTPSARLCWVRMEAGPGTRAPSRRTHPAGLPLSLQVCFPCLILQDRYRQLRCESRS